MGAIKYGNEKPSSARRFIQEYRRSLKPRETEELVNQYLNRPLAYLAAKLFQKLGLGPNVATLVSFCAGVSSGFLFAAGNYRSIIIGAALLETMIIFDCADGQLARMLGRSTPIGKTLDGLADVATHFSVFYGTAFALHRAAGSIYPFFLAFSAQLSMYLHIMLYDHFKNVFIGIAHPEYQDRLESLALLRQQVFSPEAWKKGNLHRLILRIYYLFYRAEFTIVTIGYPQTVFNFYALVSDPDRIDPYTRELYRLEMRNSVKLWSFLGDTIHLTLFILFGLLGRIAFVFPAMSLFLNLYMAVVLLHQRLKLRQLGLEREVLWQERFD